MFDILAVTLLIILALVLAVLEIFFLPGITIAGICSVLFYGGGIYYAYSAFGTNGAVITLFTNSPSCYNWNIHCIYNLWN